jgi:CRP-like cAMP-binding protein
MDDLRFFDPDLVVGANRKTVSFADRGVVFVKGDRGEFAYLVKTGSVEIRSSGRAMELVCPGGLFGEMALIDSGPRSASAVALGTTELIVIDRATFERIIQEVPDFAMSVMKLMSRRLRSTNLATFGSTVAARRIQRGVATG